MSYTGKMIRDYRYNNDIKQKDLAASLKMVSQLLYAIEKGKSTLPGKHVKTLATLMGVNYQDIVKNMTHDYVDKLNKKINN